MENVELLHQRPPNDIDVVTYFSMPAGETEESLLTGNPELFDSEAIKKCYNVDAYAIPMVGETNALTIQACSYWYSMWSHTRQGAWKGFVQVELDDHADEAAEKFLVDLLKQWEA